MDLFLVYLVYWTITKNISFLRVLVYTTQCIRGTCDNELYKLMFYLLTYLLTYLPGEPCKLCYCYCV